MMNAAHIPDIRDSQRLRPDHWRDLAPESQELEHYARTELDMLAFSIAADVEAQGDEVMVRPGNYVPSAPTLEAFRQSARFARMLTDNDKEATLIIGAAVRRRGVFFGDYAHVPLIALLEDDHEN